MAVDGGFRLLGLDCFAAYSTRVAAGSRRPKGWKVAGEQAEPQSRPPEPTHLPLARIREIELWSVHFCRIWCSNELS